MKKSRGVRMCAPLLLLFVLSSSITYSANPSTHIGAHQHTMSISVCLERAKVLMSVMHCTSLIPAWDMFDQSIEQLMGMGGESFKLPVVFEFCLA